MLRFYNPYTYEHLYTPSEEEAASLRAVGWNEEGIGWYSPVKGTQGVETIYRLYNPWGDDHLYTTNAKEKDDCLARGMKLDDKFEAYGFAAKSEVANQPVYRLFNPYEQEHTHFFTTNPSEVSDSVARGWKDEHEQWFVPGKPAETPAETPAAGESNVIIGVGTGTGSGSSTSGSDETPQPSLSEAQKADLKEASKSVDERIKETREAAVTVKNDKGETVKGADAVTILKTRSEAAAGEVTKAGDKATPEQKQKAAEAKAAYEYANAVQNLNDAQKAVDDAKGKPTTEQTQKLETAKANVNKIENAPQVTTVNVSFKDATNKDAKDLPQAGQVSVEFVRATQRWRIHLAQAPQKDDRTAFLTEAAAVKAALYNGEKLDSVKNQSSSTSVTEGEKDGEYVVTLNTTRATPTLKPGESEHTSSSSDPAQETKTQIAKDDKAPKALPELNLSIFGKDAASMHAGDKDTEQTVKEAKAKLEEQKKAIDAERETLESWRKLEVAKELFETDPSDKNLLDTRDNLQKAFDQEGAAHKKADKDFKVDSKTYIKLEQDMLVQDLKKAELDYKDAKDDTAKAAARKNAVHTAWLIMEKQAELLIGVEQKKDVFDARLNIEHALHDLDVALGQVSAQKNEALDTYIKALVTFLTDPSAKDAVKTLNATKEAYENPKKAETVTPKKQDEKKEGETTNPAPKQEKKVDQGQGNADPKKAGSTTPSDKGNSGSQDPKTPVPAKQK